MSSPLPYNRQNALASAIAADNASNIAGKVVLTTGVTQGGLGATFVEEIAKHKPTLLILAGRSPSKVQATANKIKSNPASANVEVRILGLDLASQKQIREAAEEILAYPEPHIDVLVNSAGIMKVKAPVYEPYVRHTLTSYINISGPLSHDSRRHRAPIRKQPHWAFPLH
jgi:short-subunit dehydrogenase